MMRVFINEDRGISYLEHLVQMHIQPEVIENDIIQRALADVEEIYKIEGLAMYSKQHGVKSPSSLGNGTKTLILLNCFEKHGQLLNSSSLGANIAPYVAELSLVKDFDINLNYFLNIPGDAKVDALDVETGVRVTTGSDFKRQFAGRWAGRCI